MQLSLTLRAIISQRLIPSMDGKRVAAIEILLDTPRVKDLILKGEIALLKEAMGLAYHEGMQTFDQHILTFIWPAGSTISTPSPTADSPNDVRLRIKMAEVKKDDLERKEPPFKLKIDEKPFG